MSASARSQDKSECHIGQDNDDPFLLQEGVSAFVLRHAMQSGRWRRHSRGLGGLLWRLMPADRVWNDSDASGAQIADDNEEACMGIELNIWERAKVTSYLHNSIIIIDVVVIIEVFHNTCLVCSWVLHHAHVGGWRWPA